MWTIGHSTRSLGELVDLLRGEQVTHLVDVRRRPHSRRHPQFEAAVLSRDLPAAGIAYRHAPGLGGFRTPRADSVNTAWREPAFRGYADYMDTPPFAAELDTLIRDAAAAPTAIMCAEAHPSHCHRALLSDALLARGVTVRHIIGPGRVETHALRAGARLVEGRVSYPGEPELFDPR
jgi:uncharacterized protein (DUF488 family)